jgi:hypothetical protein
LREPAGLPFFLLLFRPDVLLFLLDVGAGTLPPSRRASDRPIATACFLLVTFLPELLRSVPFFRFRIALATFFDAFAPYLAMHPSQSGAHGQRSRAEVPCANLWPSCAGRCHTTLSRAGERAGT